jgi:hypothetical protein
MSYVPWLIFLYVLYRLGKFCWIKYIQWRYTNWFLRELGRDIRNNPEAFKWAFKNGIPK